MDEARFDSAPHLMQRTRLIAVFIAIAVIIIPMASASELSIDPSSVIISLFGGEEKYFEVIVRWNGDVPIVAYSGYNITQEKTEWDGIGMYVDLQDNVSLMPSTGEVVPVSVRTDPSIMPDNYTLSIWFNTTVQAMECERDGLWGEGHEHRCLDDGTYEVCNLQGDDYVHVNVCNQRCEASPACNGYAPGTEFGTCTLYGKSYLQDRCNYDCQIEDGWCEDDFVSCSSAPECDDIEPGTGSCTYQCDYKPGIACMRDGRWGDGSEFRCREDNTYERCSENGLYYQHINVCRYLCSASFECEGMMPNTYGCDDNCHYDLTMCGNGIVNTGEECELPSTQDNIMCAQSETECLGMMLGTRDAFGDCTGNCFCMEDDFVYECSISQCGAECENEGDCAPTDCNDFDGCYEGIYRDYQDVPSYCGSDCLCHDSQCSSFVEIVTDADGDGYDTECDGDCDDSDGSVHPGAPEICNGVDDDCDGTTDEGCECIPGQTEPCGSGACGGTMECTGQGTWGSCSSEGSDCGVCCACDSGGSETYDGTQDSDCPPTSCADGCNIDSNPFTWDFSGDIENYCVALGQCSQNPCSYLHECRDDDPDDGLDGDSCGAECDQDSDCTAYCSLNIRNYGGSCDGETCQCEFFQQDCNDYDCSTPDPLDCEGEGTSMIKETGDDYGCSQGSCTMEGSMDCNGPWECNETVECSERVCGGTSHVCLFGYSYVWKSVYSEMEEICDDGHDNDCDGLTDCEDPECAGEEGPGGSVCCQADGDCNDGNDCTDDVCTDYVCENVDNDSNSCSDGLYCTVNDRCSEGLCTGDPKACDDGNGCTDDWCSEGLQGSCVFANLPDYTQCGDPRDCPDDKCILLNWTVYPQDGHDYCVAGECQEYSCGTVSSGYDPVCEPPCFTWTGFSGGQENMTMSYPPGGGYDDSAKVSVPVNINFTTARVDITGIPVSYVSDKKIDIALVNDLSGSMNDDCGPDGVAQPGETPCKVNDMKTANKNLINITLNHSYNRVGLAGYSTYLVSHTNLTGNKTALFSQIDTYEALYKTCISCGIEKGIEILGQGTNPMRVMIVLSDGMSNRCTYGSCHEIIAKEEAIGMAREAWETHGIMVYAVAFGRDADNETMMEIAEVGNGEYKYTENGNISDFYTEIITHLIETAPTDPRMDAGSNGKTEWNYTGEYELTERVKFTLELNNLTHRCHFDPCPGCEYNATSGNCTVDLNMFSNSSGELLLSELYMYGCECLGGVCPVDEPFGGLGLPQMTGLGGGPAFGGPVSGTSGTQDNEIPEPGPVLTMGEMNYTNNTLILSGCLEGGKGKIMLFVGEEKVRETDLDEEGCFRIEYSSGLPSGSNKITLWNEESEILETYINALAEEGGANPGEASGAEATEDNIITGMASGSGMASAVLFGTVLVVISFIMFFAITKKMKRGKIIVLLVALFFITAGIRGAYAVTCEADGMWGEEHEFVCLEDSTYMQCDGADYVHVNVCSSNCGSDPECSELQPSSGFCTYQCDYKPGIACMRDGMWGYDYGRPDHEFLCNLDNTYKRCLESGLGYENVDVCRYYCSASVECDGFEPETNECDGNCQYLGGGYCGDGILGQQEECELPSSTDNPNCVQSETGCLDGKLGTRDAFGDCDSGCACTGDEFQYGCVAGECGAECDVENACGEKCENGYHYFNGECDLQGNCSCAYDSEPASETCTDGRDNDCDGLTDCEDPECAGEEGPGGSVCCQSDGDCDDSNDCTDDICLQNECSFTADDANVCGIPRICPDDHCIGENWTVYPQNGHDYCMAGECREYSCDPLDSYPDERCMECDIDTFGVFLSTDSYEYDRGDDVAISGHLLDSQCGPVISRYVSLAVSDYLGTPRYIAQIKTEINGEFLILVHVPEEWISGLYEVRATFGGVINDTEFLLRQPAADHLVFSQVMYDAPGTDTLEEWIEIYNPTEEPVWAGGLTIQDNNGQWVIPDYQIGAKDYMVIARNGNGFYDLYQCNAHMEGLTLSLANSGDELHLLDGSQEIDMVAFESYETGWDLIADSGESIKRVPSSQDTDTPDDWVSNSVPSPHCISSTASSIDDPGIETDSEGEVTLNWKAQPDSGGYNVYASESPDSFFFKEPTVTLGPSASSWTDQVSSGHDEMYYIIRVIDGDGKETQGSPVLGKFTYHLQGYGSNWISIPLSIPVMSVTEMEGEIGGDFISLQMMDKKGKMHITGETKIDSGKAYDLVVSGDNDWVISGRLPGVDPVLLEGPGKNWISLPLGTGLERASGLMASMGDECESVTRWNPETQTTEGWLSFRGGSGTDFPVFPGECYEVSVSSDVYWFPE